MWPRTYPITIPVKRATVSTLELATSFVYPFFMANKDTKYPKAFNIQKNGIVNTFTMKGQIQGIRAIRAPNPENT